MALLWSIYSRIGRYGRFKIPTHSRKCSRRTVNETKGGAPLHHWLTGSGFGPGLHAIQRVCQPFPRTCGHIPSSCAPGTVYSECITNYVSNVVGIASLSGDVYIYFKLYALKWPPLQQRCRRYICCSRPCFFSHSNAPTTSCEASSAPISSLPQACMLNSNRNAPTTPYEAAIAMQAGQYLRKDKLRATS